MEEFLRDYVQMMAEQQEIELDEARMLEIVNNLASEDEIWETLDMYIYNELEGGE
jgi:hypothetical protein